MRCNRYCDGEPDGDCAKNPARCDCPPGKALCEGTPQPRDQSKHGVLCPGEHLHCEFKDCAELAARCDCEQGRTMCSQRAVDRVNFATGLVWDAGDEAERRAAIDAAEAEGDAQAAAAAAEKSLRCVPVVETPLISKRSASLVWTYC